METYTVNAQDYMQQHCRKKKYVVLYMNMITIVSIYCGVNKYVLPYRKPT